MAKIHRLIPLLCLLAACTALFAGCIDKQKLKVMFGSEQANASVSAAVLNAGADLDAGGEGDTARQSFDINGSVGVLPLIKLLGETFSASNGCIVNVAAGGKDAAIAAVDSAEADAALYEENGTPGNENGQVIASDGVMLIVGAAFPADSIKFGHIVALFTDQDNMIGDKEVQLVLTEPGSHTRQIFEGIFPVKGEVEGVQQSLVPAAATSVERDADVVDEVLANPSAIGVVSIGTDLRGAKALLIDGQSLQDENYAAREQIALYMAQPQGELASAFASFIRSDAAKKILSDNGYSLR